MAYCYYFTEKLTVHGAGEDSAGVHDNGVQNIKG
jgi:hypothetical protein